MKSLSKLCLLAGLAFSATAMASPLLHHHNRGFGLKDDCGSSQAAVCLTFRGDDSLVDSVEVYDHVNATVNGQSYNDDDYDYIGSYDYYTDEIDLSDVKAFNLTSFDEYFSSVAGTPVGRLCDVHLTAKDFKSAKQITMTLHKDSDGHYSCKRS